MSKNDFRFDTDNEEFVRGFAAGQTWGHLTCGEPRETAALDFVATTSNETNLRNMAEALDRELELEIYPGGQEMWVTYKETPDHQKKVPHPGWDPTVAREGKRVKLSLHSYDGPCYLSLSPEETRILAEELLRFAAASDALA